MRMRGSLGVLAGALLAVGCGSSANLTAIAITGSVVAGNLPVPAGAKVYLIWSVTTVSPDYVYKFGEGAAQGGAFTVKVTSVPPTDALNGGEFGVGLLAYATAQAALSDGKINDTTQLTNVQIGGAEKAALIYRKPGSTAPAGHWLQSFPEGFSCGRVVPPTGGSSFDTFTPTSCAAVEIKSDSAPSFPNWT